MFPELTRSIGATFAVATGALSVTGDPADNTLTVGRNAAGTILVNGGSVPIQGGPPAITTLRQSTLIGLEGKDTLRVDEAFGPLPVTTLDGGAGDDVLVGGDGADEMRNGEVLLP